MIDNHDDSDEIDLPVLPAFARLHPNDHPLAVDRGEASGDPASWQRPSIQDFCQRVVCKRGLNQRRAEVQPVALVIEHKAAQATAARSGLMINGELSLRKRRAADDRQS